MPSKSGGKGKKKNTSHGVALPAMGEDRELDAGEVVLAKMALLPLLPGMIAADSELPDFMIRIRPSNSQSAKVKNTASNETYYPVRFFPKGDYIPVDQMQAADPDKWLESLAEKEEVDETKGKAKEAGSGDSSRSTGTLDCTTNVAAGYVVPPLTAPAALDTATPGRKRSRDESPVREPETSVPELVGPKKRSATNSRGCPPEADDWTEESYYGENASGPKAKKTEAEPEPEVEIEDEEASRTQSYEDGEETNGLSAPHVAKQSAPPDTPLESPAVAPETEPKEEIVSRRQNTADERASKRRNVDNGTYTIASRRMGADTRKIGTCPKHRLQLPTLQTEADNLLKSLEWFGEINIEYLAYSKLLAVMKRISLADDEWDLRNNENRIHERAAAFIAKWEAALNGKRR
ncbi:hypothetical protein C8F01DRAFT_1083549 [Mycena amicta]|nr:hypothetical protein C8F01DRAFT_1083549 [Mycena amicta]